MNFLNLTSFLKIRYTKVSKEKEEAVVAPLVTPQITDIEYWKQQLSGDLPKMEWPISRVQPVEEQAERGQYAFIIPSLLKEKIFTYINHHNIELSVFLLAALRIILFRYSGQQDLIIGNLLTTKEVTEDGLAGHP